MCKLCTYAYTKVVYKYMLHGQILESVGVTITHINKMSSKAKISFMKYKHVISFAETNKFHPSK